MRIDIMARKKGAGGKLARTEVVQARLNPKLRMAAEIMARQQRRTLSSFFEELVDKAAKEQMIDIQPKEIVRIDTRCPLKGKKSLHIPVIEAVKQMWEVEEADRFSNFAISTPDLLTFEEEQLWSFICEKPYFWTYFRYEDDKISKIFQWYSYEGLIYKNLRRCWPYLPGILAGKPIPKDNDDDVDMELLDIPGSLTKVTQDFLHQQRVIDFIDI